MSEHEKSEHGTGLDHSDYSGQNELIESFYEKETLKEKIDDFIKSSPWWLISIATHAVVIFLLTLVVTMEAQKPEEVVVVQTDMIEEVIEEEKEELKDKLEEKEVEVEDVQVEDVVEEVVEEVVEIETDIDVEVFEEEVVTDQEINDVSFDADVSSDDLGTFGVGDSGGGIKGGMLGLRGSRKGRRGAVSRGGGGKNVLDVVDRALRYLARVQRPDGAWTGDPEIKKLNNHDNAITSLALLCFLGAGHTEMSGKYKSNVQKAVKYLISVQGADGSFGRNLTYVNSICTMAMAEAAAMANKSKTRMAAQKGVDWCFMAQTRAGSWTYTEKETAPTDKNPQGKQDTSVAGWMMMAIKSSKLAGLKLDEVKVKKALAAFDRATTSAAQDFTVAYQVPIRGHATKRMQTMTLVGMCIKEFFGMKKNNPQLVQPAKWLYDQQYAPTFPNKGKVNRANGYYAMYYGALVNFQMGGKYWTQWRDGMLASLEPTQDKAGGLFDGSWDHDIVGKDHQHGWEKSVLRTGVTAFNTLSMEVFWRYNKQ